MEQSVLLAAATIYMDYLRDAAILEVQRSNIKVLELTLKQTRDRYSAGLVTPTDVAQSQAQLAAAQSQELAAESTLDDHAREFPPHHRQRAGEPPGGLPGRPLSAANRRKARRKSRSGKTPT